VSAPSSAIRTKLFRSQFVQRHFYRDPNDPANYDLVVNSGRFSLEDCAHIVMAGLHALRARLIPEET
jgi:hypothetical protein